MMKKHKNKVRGLFSTGMFITTIVFFYAPLLILTTFSFNSSKSMTWEGFSLRWYIELFNNSPALWDAFGKSIWIALTSGLIATAIGTLAGIGFFRYQLKHKKQIQTFFLLPLLLPEIILGVASLIFFSNFGIKLGLLTIFIAHTTFCVPYVFLTILARMEEFDQTIIEAAYDLGATEKDVLWKVLIPMCMPAIIAGFLLSITLSLEDFVITFFVSGPGSTTLPLYIYSMIRFGVSPVINALSVLLLFGSMLLGLATIKYNKDVISK